MRRETSCGLTKSRNVSSCYTVAMCSSPPGCLAFRKMLLSCAAFLFCRGKTACERVQGKGSLVMETYYPFTRQAAVTRGHRQLETSTAEDVHVCRSAVAVGSVCGWFTRSSGTESIKKKKGLSKFDLRGKEEAAAAAKVCPDSTASVLTPPAASITHVSGVSVAAAGKTKRWSHVNKDVTLSCWAPAVLTTQVFSTWQCRPWDPHSATCGEAGASAHGIRRWPAQQLNSCTLSRLQERDRGCNHHGASSITIIYLGV